MTTMYGRNLPWIKNKSDCNLLLHLWRNYTLYEIIVSTWYVGHYLSYITSPGCDRWWWVWSSRWNENSQGKPKYWEKICPNATLSTTNPTLRDLGSNLGLRHGKPAINRLSYCTALYFMKVKHFNLCHVPPVKYSSCLQCDLILNDAIEAPEMGFPSSANPTRSGGTWYWGRKCITFHLQSTYEPRGVSTVEELEEAGLSTVHRAHSGFS
jgi:hypothetical protein